MATSEKKVLTRMENEKHYEGFVNFEDGGSEGTISASLSLALCFHDEVTIFFFFMNNILHSSIIE